MADIRYDESTVSDEPLDIIRANECEYHPGSLSTQRFRRLWNEIVDLRAALESEKAPRPKPEGSL